MLLKRRFRAAAPAPPPSRPATSGSPPVPARTAGAVHQVNGAMKILEQQILEIQETSEANQPSDTEASTPQEATAPSE